MVFRLNNNENLNVFIYEGIERANSSKMLVEDNRQAAIGVNYSVPIESGILVIAFPDKDKSTSFEFEYFIEEVPQAGEPARIVPVSTQVNNTLQLYIGILSCCFIAVCLPWFYQMYK